MGVIIIIDWILKKGKGGFLYFRSIFSPGGINQPKDVDCVYLDGNSLLHGCYGAHPTITREETFDKSSAAMITSIETHLQLFRPKFVLLAFDGVPVPAKVPEQIERRAESFESAMECENASKPNYYDNMVFRHEMCPGSPFMDHLRKDLKAKIEARLSSNNELWQGLTFIVSDSYVKGEGEHKILSFIKEHLAELSKFRSHAIFSKDTDVQLLAVGVPLDNIFTYYDETEDKSQRGFAYVKCDIDTLRNIIWRDVLNIKEDLDKYLKYRQLYDFIFMTIFVGNDYIPSSNSISLRVLQSMVDYYEGNNGFYLTKFTTVLYDNLSRLLRKVAVEDSYFHSGEMIVEVDRRQKRIIGSETEEKCVEKFVKSVRCSWELYVKGETCWLWSYLVDRVPTIAMICAHNNENLWKASDGVSGEGTHEMNPLIHFALLLPYASLKLQPIVLPESYLHYRLKPETNKLYGPYAFPSEEEKGVVMAGNGADMNVAYASSSDEEEDAFVPFDGERLVTEMRLLEGNLKEEDSSPMVLSSQSCSNLIESLTPASSEDIQKKLKRTTFCIEPQPYTEEKWNSQIGGD